MTIAIGIDVGGTKTAIGLIDEQGHIRNKQSLPTDLGISPAQMVARMAAVVQAMLDESSISSSEIAGIGIGAPGPLDTRAGLIDCPPNLPGWQGFALVAELRRHFDVPIRMENDATAAALAEKWLGAAQASEHFAFVTISTGIGAGLYAHGRLLTGASGNAGDAGHIVIDPAAGRCACGQLGCWEWVASGTAIARQATELRGIATTAKEAFELAAAGDALMQPLVERVYRYIGMGCVSLINLLDPELIVLGGGVAQIGEPLFAAVAAYVSAHALGPRGRQTPIVPAGLKTEAGLIGAAALVHVPY
ncbi:ROK family protein [Paenibacillus athensensis]|uniref:Transcriptional regulator n=1 Tax=Paenibacillus athensensis TaxID=1967502 RepID=A0A4Y8PY81_9BACL|nr:ROK family protein [Paenibacillus athensensis]MCD1259653.1 ROK family protein [Paenibacillus athensensis]